MPPVRLPIMFENDIQAAEECNWFVNSFDAVRLDPNVSDYDIQYNCDRIYEERYGVKLIYEKIEFMKGGQFVRQVEFPSEEAATLFMLQWT